MAKNVLTREKIIRGLIVSLAIGVTVFLVVFFLTLDKNTLKSFQHMENEFLLLAAGAIFLSVIIEGLRIQAVARAINEKIGYWESVKIFYISFFLGGVTPYFSGAIPSQVILFTNRGISVGSSTMIATIRPIIKSAIFLIITPILFFIFRESMDEYELLSWMLLIMAIFFSFFFIFFFVLAVRNPQKIEVFIDWLKSISFFNKFLDKPAVKEKLEWMTSQAIQFHKSFNLLLKHPIEIFLAFLYTGIYWFIYFSIAPFLLMSMGIELNYALVMVIQVLIFFVLPFLPTPGGSGAAELGFASLFSFFVPEHLLGIYVGGWRLFTFYINILIGALLSLVELRRWAAQEKLIKNRNN